MTIQDSIFWNIDIPDYGFLHRTSADTQTPERLLIVYVHGILGDPKATWGELPAEVLATVDRDIDTFSYGYPAGVLHEASIEQATEDLIVVLRNRFRDYRHFVFITHSTGGLILKNLIRSERVAIEESMTIEGATTPVDAVTFKTRAIVNVTVPHFGGQRAIMLVAKCAYGMVYPVAWCLSRLAPVLGQNSRGWGRNHIVSQLGWRNPWLIQLEEDFTNLVGWLDAKVIPRPVSTEILARLDTSVSQKIDFERLQKGKASIYVHDDGQAIILRGTHGSVKKPKRSKHAVIASVIAKLLEPLLSATEAGVARFTVRRGFILDSADEVDRMVPSLGATRRNNSSLEAGVKRGSLEMSGSQESAVEWLMKKVTRPNLAPKTFVVTGDAGVGKSVVLRRLAMKLSVDFLSNRRHQHLALMMLLQQVQLSGEDLRTFLANPGNKNWTLLRDHWLAWANKLFESEDTDLDTSSMLEPDWFDARLQHAPTVLVLDGVDEFLINNAPLSLEQLLTVISAVKDLGHSNTGLSIVLGVRSSLPEIGRLVDSERDIFRIGSLTAPQATEMFGVRKNSLERLPANIQKMVLTPLILKQIGGDLDTLVSHERVTREEVIRLSLEAILQKSKIPDRVIDDQVGAPLDAWMTALALMGSRFFATRRPEMSNRDLEEPIRELTTAWTEHLKCENSEDEGIRRGIDIALQPASRRILFTRSVFFPTGGDRFRFRHRVWADYLTSRYLAQCVTSGFAVGLGEGAFTDVNLEIAAEMLKPGDITRVSVGQIVERSVADRNEYILANFVSLLGDSFAPISREMIDQLVGCFEMIPPIVRYAVLASLSYRVIRNDEQDRWVQTLRDALVDVTHDCDAGTIVVNDVTKSLLWCYRRALEAKNPTGVDLGPWPGLWNTKVQELQAVEMLCTPKNGGWTFTDRLSTAQRAFLGYLKSLPRYPQKAIKAMHHIHVVVSAYKVGACDELVAGELPRVIANNDIDRVIRSYDAVPELATIWDRCRKIVGVSR